MAKGAWLLEVQVDTQQSGAYQVQSRQATSGWAVGLMSALLVRDLAVELPNRDQEKSVSPDAAKTRTRNSGSAGLLESPLRSHLIQQGIFGCMREAKEPKNAPILNEIPVPKK